MIGFPVGDSCVRIPAPSLSLFVFLLSDSTGVCARLIKFVYFGAN